MATLPKSRRKASTPLERFPRDPLLEAARNSMQRSRRQLGDLYRRMGELQERQSEWGKHANCHADACVPPVYAYPVPPPAETLAMRDISNWRRDLFSRRRRIKEPNR